MRPFAAPVLLVALLAGCIPPGPPDDPMVPAPLRTPTGAAMVGCWRIEADTPEQRARFGEPLVLRFDSVRIEYDGTVVRDGERLTLVVVGDTAGHPRRRGFSTWGVRAADGQVRAIVSNGFHGSTLVARVRGERLVGRWAPHADVPIPRRSVAVRGVRVPCPDGA